MLFIVLIVCVFKQIEPVMNASRQVIGTGDTHERLEQTTTLQQTKKRNKKNKSKIAQASQASTRDERIDEQKPKFKSIVVFVILSFMGSLCGLALTRLDLHRPIVVIIVVTAAHTARLNNLVLPSQNSIGSFLFH
jgi:hypothetical protein